MSLLRMDNTPMSHGPSSALGFQTQGVPVQPGDWIYADADGILVAQQMLA